MIPSMSNMAPLASMEDISLAGTPLPTPGPSPRTRNRWSHRSSLGMILDEEEEDDKSDTELDHQATSIDADTDPLISRNEAAGLSHPNNHKPAPVPTDGEPDERLRLNGQSPAYKLSPQSCQYTATDTKYPSPCVTQVINTKPVAEMQFLTPRRNFRKRSELHPVYEYFEIGEAHRPPARDRCNLVFLNFVFQGLAASLPFSLITVSKKFHQAVFSGCHDSFLDCQSSDFSWLQSLPNFLLVSLTFQLISALPSSLFPVRWFSTRVSVSIAALVISVLMLVISVMTNLSMYLIIPCMVLHSIFTGLYITTTCGMVARLPTRHISGLVIGLSLSGVVASLLEVVEILLNVSTRIVIIYYLIIILAAYLIAFDLHFALPISTYYQHYHCSLPLTPQPGASTQYTLYTLYTLLYISTFLTCTVWPAILRDTAPISTIFTSQVELFTLLACYLNFYLSTCLGILSSTFSHLPWSWLPVILIIIRLALLPVLLVSNYLPDTRELVVVVQWDWSFALTVTIFSVLGGFVHMHLIASVLRCASNMQAKSMMAMRCSVVVLLGMLTGVGLSFTLPLIVNSQI